MRGAQRHHKPERKREHNAPAICYDDRATPPRFVHPRRVWLARRDCVRIVFYYASCGSRNVALGVVSQAAVDRYSGISRAAARPERRLEKLKDER